MMKERNWSYRKLEIITDKAHTYWNGIVKGRDAVPKPKVLKEIARDFGVDPKTILEYKQYLAIEKLKKNPEMLDVVLDEREHSPPGKSERGRKHQASS